MELEIKNEKVNVPLERTELEVEIKASATPKRSEIIKTISAMKNTSEELVVVKKIHQETGKHTSKAIVYVYRNKEAMRIIEPEYILKRKKKEAKEAEQSG